MLTYWIGELSYALSKTRADGEIALEPLPEDICSVCHFLGCVGAIGSEDQIPVLKVYIFESYGRAEAHLQQHFDPKEHVPFVLTNRVAIIHYFTLNHA